MNLGKYIVKIGWRLRGLDPFSAYSELKKHETYSEAELKNLQNDMVAKLIASAYTNVPYYRDLMVSLKLKPEDIRTVDDLGKLPILTKDIIRAQKDRMRAKNYSPDSIVSGSTGGSTGEPIPFYREKEIGSWMMGGLWRNYNRCGWEIGEKIGFLWGYRRKDWAMPWWKMRLREFLSQTTRADPFNLDDDQMELALRKFNKARPVILMGYASALDRFAGYLRRTGQKLEHLKGIYSSAEKLYPEIKRNLENIFQCGVFDFYGSGETPHIACTCRRGIMHVNPDFVVLEKGEKVEESGANAILSTALRSYAMPFIRYRNEDTAIFRQEDCDCGLRFPSIDLRIARTTDFFKFKNGRVVHGEYFTHEIFGAFGIKAFQFHQISEEKIILQIVAGNEFGPADSVIIEKAKKLIDKHSDGTTRVEVQFVDSIKTSHVAKHRFTISDLEI